MKKIQKLSINIVELEKDKGSSSSRKQFKPYFKKREVSGNSQPHLINSVVLNFNEVGMDHLCTFHLEHNSRKKFSQWINSMILVTNHLLDAQLIEPKVEEDQKNDLEETNEETTMVLWDWAPTLGLSEEEQTKEI